MKRYSDGEILAAFEQAGRSPSGAAKILGMGERNVHTRLAKLEGTMGPLRPRQVPAQVRINRDTRPNPITLQDGTVLVASDCHYWPGEPSTAHRAFVHLCGKLGPAVVVVNGDEFDGASISRHGRIGWEHRPTVAQELSAVQERLGEIKRAAGSGCHLLGTYGNHTLRFETYLAAHASAVEGVPGMRYEDYVPAWSYAWAWLVNGHTLIKHRIKNGIHATWNNTGEAQISTVTGHLHQLKVTPRTTMSPVNNGRIYGVDSGMLADPWHPAFAYVEQGPRNWSSGFAVLTFKNGILMPPELCEVIGEGLAFFRGEVLSV